MDGCLIGESTQNQARVRTAHAICFALLASFFSTLALSSRVVVEAVSPEEKIAMVFPVYPGQLLASVVLALAFYFVAKKTRWNGVACVLSILLSACIVVGRSFDLSGSLHFAKDGLFYLSVSVICWLGFAFVTYAAIAVGYYVLDKLRESRQAIFLGGRVSATVQRHPFLFPFTLILVCWLPYVIALLPGVTCYDLIAQLQQFFDAYEPTNHHPWFMTLLFGALYQLGFVVGGGAVI